MLHNKFTLTIITLMVALLSISAGTFYLAAAPDTGQDSSYRFASVTAGGPQEYLATGETLAVKNETVYVLLSSDGTLLNQRIVNRIYDSQDHDAALIVDYGEYLHVENMVADAAPQVEDNRLLWESSLLSEADLYYEGLIDKDLPLSVSISYYLDDQAISAADLAGKNGPLKIILTFNNNLNYEEPVSYYDHADNLVTKSETNYVPLLVQGTFSVDLNRFANIEVQDGNTIITGQSAAVNFMSFPYPESSITLNMDGSDIELDKITFVVSPQMPPLPVIDIEDELLQMLEGVSLLSGGIRELSNGADQLLQGLVRFQAESDKMLENSEMISDLITTYGGQIKDYKSLLDQVNPAQLAQSLDNLQELLQAVNDLPDPNLISDEIATISGSADGLTGQIETLNSRLADLESSGSIIRAEAGRLMAASEPGSEPYAMGLLLLEREEEINSALAQSNRIADELNLLSTATDSLDRQWQNSYLPVMLTIQELGLLTDNDPSAMLDQLSALLGEMGQLEEYFAQIDNFLIEAEAMLGELSKLPEALDQMVYGQTQLRDGLNQLHTDGILAMEEGLIEGINESRYGKAKIELMQKLADDYRSYADNDHNRSSEVQFIIQTAAITVDLSSDGSDNLQSDEPETANWSGLLWARLINLFE
jgi:putative membrane protein